MHWQLLWYIYFQTDRDFRILSRQANMGLCLRNRSKPTTVKITHIKEKLCRILQFHNVKFTSHLSRKAIIGPKMLKMCFHLLNWAWYPWAWKKMSSFLFHQSRPPPLPPQKKATIKESLFLYFRFESIWEETDRSYRQAAACCKILEK